MATRIRALIFAASMLAAGATAAAGQQAKTGQLLDALFAPITDQLNLTPEQQAQIEAIANAEFVRSEALILRLNEVTAYLDEEQLKETFDEDRVRALAAQGGHVMTEIAVVKLRVKAKVFALLTPEQKALVVQQLRLNRERSGGVSLY